MIVSGQAMKTTQWVKIHGLCMVVGSSSRSIFFVFYLVTNYIFKAHKRICRYPANLFSRRMSTNVTGLVIKHEIATLYRCQIKGSKIYMHIEQDQC